MATRRYEIGDWAQALTDQIDEDMEGNPVEAGRKGDICHVIEMPNKEGWPNVLFERTGRVTLVHPEDLLFLGDMDTGTGKTSKKERTSGN